MVAVTANTLIFKSLACVISHHNCGISPKIQKQDLFGLIEFFSDGCCKSHRQMLLGPTPLSHKSGSPSAQRVHLETAKARGPAKPEEQSPSGGDN